MEKSLKILFFFLLCLPFFGKAQLKGKYWASDENELTIIQFLENNVFKFQRGSCKPKFGSGHYKLTKHTLLLKFESQKSKFIISNQKCEKDSINLKFTILDNSLEPAGGAVIVLKDKQDKIINGAYAYENGKAELKLAKSTQKIQIMISFLVSDYKIGLKTDKNYNIEAHLYDNFSSYSEKKIKFKIKKISKNSILVKELNNKSYYYKKITNGIKLLEFKKQK